MGVGSKRRFDMNDTTNIHHDTPVAASSGDKVWGSDAIAAMLRALDLPYIALNPGASYRVLHDSLVNYLCNRNPEWTGSSIGEEPIAILMTGGGRLSSRPMPAAPRFGCARR